MSIATLDLHHHLSYRPVAQDSSRRIKGLVLVIALHAVLGYALVSGVARKGLNLIKKPLEAVVIQEVILPPPPPPPPPLKEIRPPDPKTPKAEAPPPVAQDVPPPPVARALEPPPIRDAPPPVALGAAPVVMQAAPLPPPPPAPDSGRAQAASLEGEYASKLRAMLNASKRYPTGRAASQQRPQGSVKVWFTLARGGALLDAGILESSNSNLLDDAALATVRRGVYPPFPPNTWAGQEQHKFSAEMDFQPPSS